MATAGIPSMSFLAKFGGKPQIATLQNSGSGRENTEAGTGPMFPDFQLPDWLSTDPDALVGELMSEYTGTGKMFDTGGIRRGYNKAIDTAMGMGGQIADNAMRESIARSGQGGGEVNSAMVKAQSMLPVYEHTAGLRKDKALAMADVRAREAGMRAQLASNIGQMRTAYLSMLADTYMRGRTASASWLNSNRDFTLRDREMDMREMAFEGVGGSGGGGGGGGSGRSLPPFQGQITRAPNNSGMGGPEYTPEFLEYLKATNQTSSGPPRYPGATGITGGPALDEYNAEMRNIISMATGQPAYNARVMDVQGAFEGAYATDPRSAYDPVTGRYGGKPVIRTY